MTARPVPEVVKFGLAAMDDNPADFTEYLCTTEAEQAKPWGCRRRPAGDSFEPCAAAIHGAGGWTWASGQRC